MFCFSIRSNELIDEDCISSAGLTVHPENGGWIIRSL
jgi:hypothetical protein